MTSSAALGGRAQVGGKVGDADARLMTDTRHHASDAVGRRRRPDSMPPAAAATSFSSVAARLLRQADRCGNLGRRAHPCTWLLGRGSLEHGRASDEAAVIAPPGGSLGER